MSVKVEFSTDNEVLIATASGKLNPESDERLDKEIAIHCRHRNCRRLLIDFRQVDGELKRVDLYHGGASLEQRGFRRETTIAFVDRPEFAKANEFYETVASNRGFQMRHFYDMDEALDWLKDLDD